MINTTYTCTIETPLGPMTAAAHETGLIGLWFVGQRYYPAGAADFVTLPDHPHFGALRCYLAQYFAGGRECHELSLVPQGSPFQREVWKMLAAIPYGTTVTYGGLAREIAALYGRPSMSAQAVGGAVGHNPISVLVPCHRVVGSSGSLTGYAGGLHRKEALLRLEGRSG